MRTPKVKPVVMMLEGEPDFVDTIWQSGDGDGGITSVEWQRDYLFGLALHLYTRSNPKLRLSGMKAGLRKAGRYAAKL